MTLANAPQPVAVIAANSRRMMTAAGATPTRAGCLALAQKYEAGYRRARASKRPPAPHLLAGMAYTARAFYYLARTAEG